MAGDGVATSVGVRVGAAFCALPIASVRQVVRPLGVTSVPARAAGFLGFAEHHGRALPVFALAELVGMPGDAEAPGSAAKWLVLEHAARDFVLVVDAVTGVFSLELRLGLGPEVGASSPALPAVASTREGRRALPGILAGVTAQGGRPLLLLELAGLLPLLDELGCGE